MIEYPMGTEIREGREKDGVKLCLPSAYTPAFLRLMEEQEKAGVPFASLDKLPRQGFMCCEDDVEAAHIVRSYLQITNDSGQIELEMMEHLKWEFFCDSFITAITGVDESLYPEKTFHDLMYKLRVAHTCHKRVVKNSIFILCGKSASKYAINYLDRGQLYSGLNMALPDKDIKEINELIINKFIDNTEELTESLYE